MKTVVVIFNIEQGKYFNHKVNGFLASSINSASEYPNQSFAEGILWETKGELTNLGLSRFRFETVTVIN